MKKSLIYISIFILLSKFLLSVEEAYTNDLTKRIKILINKLDSTIPISEQEYAKSELAKIGKDGLQELHKYLLKDKRTYVRVQIAFILGAIKDESSIKFLAEAGKSQYKALTKACVISLGKIGGEKSLEALKKLRKFTKDEEIIQIIDDNIKKLSGE